MPDQMGKVTPIPNQPNPKQPMIQMATGQNSPGTNLMGGLITLIIGIWLLWFELAGSQSVLVQSQSGSWPSVTATITSSGITNGQSCGKSGCYATYTPSITYTYTVAGRQYTGSNISFSNGQLITTSLASAQQTDALYSVGSTHNVYYNPSNPSFAVFVTGVNQGAWFAVGFGVVCLLISAIFLRAYLTQPK